MRVAIIGAGPAGMMAAITAAKNGHSVTVIDKNKNVGKKLSITGKGRCNISYVGDNDYFLSNVVTNSKFMMSSINNFDNKDLIKFVNGLNVKTKEERGNRVFLESDDASELSIALEKEGKRLGINKIFSTKVTDILISGSNKELKEVVFDSGAKLEFDAVVIATGGKSYPGTGSNGEGYELAKKLGHNITSIKPALVPFILYEDDVCKALEGVSLKNVGLKVVFENKIIDDRFGELMFTRNGITGPIVLSSSSKINKYDLSKLKDKSVKAVIDLKPALSYEELYKRITKDFEENINKEFKNSLNKLTISSLIPYIIKRSGIPESKKINSITKEEKLNLTKVFKEFEFTLKGLADTSMGIVTSGGVDTKQINPKNMESKLVPGIYFAGEIIDVDAYTGGFNLQIAFSTGYTAGNSIKEV